MQHMFLKYAMIILSIFYSFEVYSKTNNISDGSGGVINIISYYKVNKNGESIYVKNISKGFIYSRDYYFVTTFSNIKGAELVYAETGGSDKNKLIKLYPEEDISKTYYFQDEQRDLIIFKLNTFKSEECIIPGDKLPAIGEQLYLRFDSITKHTGKVENIIDIIKSQWIVMKFNSENNPLPGTPVINGSNKCSGIVLHTEYLSGFTYVLSSEQIDNAALTLNSNLGTVKLRPQIDDYIMSPYIFSNTIKCSEDEINMIKLF